MLEAIIFDWAGTLVDYGSRAPLQAFIDLFEQDQVAVTPAQARVPMGSEKREHICLMLEIPEVRQAWLAQHGQMPNDSQIDEMYQRLIPLQQQQIDRHAQLVPGALTLMEELKARNIKVGTTTGYGRAMIGGLLEQARAQGFAPASVVAADDVGIGRPAATAALQNLVNLKVRSVKHCVKVDDTAPGIAEGLNAGMWSVAVVLSGNALGLSFDEFQAHNERDRQRLRDAAYLSLADSGAHYYIDSVAELSEVLLDIQRRLARGERP